LLLAFSDFGFAAGLAAQTRKKKSSNEGAMGEDYNKYFNILNIGNWFHLKYCTHYKQIQLIIIHDSLLPIPHYPFISRNLESLFLWI
jgi:hypothetical protein